MDAKVGVWLLWFAAMASAIGMFILFGLVVAFLLTNLPQQLVGLALVALVGVVVVNEVTARGHRAG